jgi:hypothetical protein
MITNHNQVSQQINKSYDVITPDNIKMALFFRTSHFQQPNPLECLKIVERHISNSLFPECIYAHKLALLEILISIVTSQLIRHRELMEIPHKIEECSISRALRAIIADGNTSNSELIGWSWLYYRCVRIELGMTQQKFCELVRLDDRTIRRYQDIALNHITETILAEEWNIRRSDILESQAIVKTRFSEAEMTVTLKPQTIMDILRSDQSLMRAFIEFFESTINDERAALNASSQLQSY